MEIIARYTESRHFSPSNMLVALLEQERILASLASKGPTYYCPGCSEEVILKKGRKVIHHFSHKPPVTCNWAAGETSLHLGAKEAFYNFFNAKGIPVEIELPLASKQLRADVHVIGRNGTPTVFELQHSSIALDEIERRTRLYFQEGIALTWIPLIQPEKLNGEVRNGKIVIKRYTPKPFERWLHGFNYGHIWYFDPKNIQLWHGTLEKSMIDVPVSEWYEEGGNLASAGGYTRISKRWKKLTLTGPISLDAVAFKTKKREMTALGKYWYPSGKIVSIQPQTSSQLT